MKPVIKIQERLFTITLTETQACRLVERLKFRQTHIPDLTEEVWEPLEQSLGYIVEETPDI